ncbi:DUF6491 family protein [Pleionea sediminis]|uniref:DUF6491 family protein n=1 Tax=Pleionea sediminis TaxID=2569479 RepID=UPI001185B4BC|nr:DUF6491 family protein [Pleionea sediminis]
MKPFGVVLILLLSVLLGCSTVKKTKSDDIYKKYIKEQKLEKSARITAFRFHGWNSLNREYLIVSTSFNKPYLLTLNTPCNDLPFAHRIVIDNDGSSLDAGFDSIVVPDSIAGKCRIKSIYKLTKEQADELTALKP